MDRFDGVCPPTFKTFLLITKFLLLRKKHRPVLIHFTGCGLLGKLLPTPALVFPTKHAFYANFKMAKELNQVMVNKTDVTEYLYNAKP